MFMMTPSVRSGPGWYRSPVIETPVRANRLDRAGIAFAPADPPARRGRIAAMPPARSWEQMRESIAARLLRQTGHDVTWWNRRIAERAERGGLGGEPELRNWLHGEGVTGYQQMLLVMETFGYPGYLLASADELVEAQYADRPGLRPILDAVIAAAATFGEIEVQARKTYTSLLTPRRTFAAVRAATRTRVDVGLRIDGIAPGGRLLDGSRTAGGSVNLRLPLTSVDDLDDEAVALIGQAYRANQ
jgi:hypothetical protein